MLTRLFHWLKGTPIHQVSGPMRIPPVQPTQAVHAANVPPDISGLPRSQRIFMEQQVLAQRFPDFRWLREGEGARIEGLIRTSAGQLYQIRVVVPAAFPYHHPQAFVLAPIKGYGCSLTEVSHAMHTLSPDTENHPQLCLYNDRNWTPSLTLHHVLVKAAVWLEAFEQHRRTKRPISEFLASS